MSNLKKQKKSIEGSEDISLLSLAWDLGWMITIPIVVLAVGGAYLDKKMGTTPWMLVGGVVLSITITSGSVYYKVMKILGEINKGD